MLFTLITDYKGGTYISQIQAKTAACALEISKKPIGKLLNTTLDSGDDIAVAISGTSGVWGAATVDLEDNLVLIHIVQTEVL